jgi:hypothetical protein
MDQSIYHSDPAFPGWNWTIKGLVVKAHNMTEPHRICSVILRAKDNDDIDNTIIRAKEEIRKHEKEEKLKNVFP